MDKAKVMSQAEAEVMPVIMTFYEPGTPLTELLLTHSIQSSCAIFLSYQRYTSNHSRLVAEKALDCMERHPELDLDAVEVARAALLHDIGIIRTDAKGIHCYGTEPYIRHGILGRAMLEEKGLQQEAMVCERHTGAGISAEEIEMAQMPLPVRDMLPQTML